ncbi:MAG: PIN domain-containing protein, partial [Gammaproteobacteria bacterium]
MHDPTAIFRFDEHDIFLPMVVLEELDAGKKGMSEASRNVRQVSRFLDEMMHDVSKAQIDAGLVISGPHRSASAAVASGRLFFQTEALPSTLPDLLPGNKPDNHILATTLALQERFADTRVALVSKDINLRIKAAVLGIHAEDYSSDKALDDLDLLFTG